LEGSDAFSTQTPLQSVMPLGHTQLFAEQDAPVGQAWPHMPQLLVLVVRSTQVLLQELRPVAQAQ